MFLNGEGIRGKDSRGERITDRNFIVLFNANDTEVEFVLPADEFSPSWEVVVDTAGKAVSVEPVHAESTLIAQPRSTIVLRAWAEAAPELDTAVAASLQVLTNSTAGNAHSTRPEVE